MYFSEVVKSGLSLLSTALLSRCALLERWCWKCYFNSFGENINVKIFVFNLSTVVLSHTDTGTPFVNNWALGFKNGKLWRYQYIKNVAFWSCETRLVAIVSITAREICRFILVTSVACPSVAKEWLATHVILAATCHNIDS